MKSLKIGQRVVTTRPITLPGFNFEPLPVGSVGIVRGRLNGNAVEFDCKPGWTYSQDMNGAFIVDSLKLAVFAPVPLTDAGENRLEMAGAVVRYGKVIPNGRSWKVCVWDTRGSLIHRVDFQDGRQAASYAKMLANRYNVVSQKTEF
jgi:hypothetical protein